MTFNLPVIVKMLGVMLLLTAFFMMLALGASLLTGESELAFAFAVPCVIMLVIGLPCLFIKTGGRRVYMRDCLLLVSLAWILSSVFSCLPYIISGIAPSFTDALFEGVSGITATGATIFSDVEALPKSILLWRALTQWLGGLFLLILIFSMLCELDIGCLSAGRWKTATLVPERLSFKFSSVSASFVALYAAMTLIAVTLLFAGGASLFDSICHGLTLVPGGGFGTHNDNLGYFDDAFILFVAALFSLLSSLNFYLFLHVIKKRAIQVVKDSELKFYLLVITSSVLVIGLCLYFKSALPLQSSFGIAAFQTVSIISTSGFFISDISSFPVICRTLLLVLMFVGGCSASMAGGIKSIRVLILIRAVLKNLDTMLHPSALIPVKLGKNQVLNETVGGVIGFAALYAFIFFTGAFVVSFDAVQMDDALTASAACLSGSGFGLWDSSLPTCYAEFGRISKWYLSFLMIAGRLELYAVLLLLTPGFWRQSQ